MKKVTKTIRANDGDDYLAAIPEKARATLKKLRKTIKAATPKLRSFTYIASHC